MIENWPLKICHWLSPSDHPRPNLLDFMLSWSDVARDIQTPIPMKIKILALLGCWIACQPVFAQPSTNAALDRVARADNAFGFKLLAETRKALPGGNVFQSPVGMAQALTMAANGAQGQTLQQMAATLELPVTQEEWNAGNKKLLDHLLGLDPKIKLEIANSLWTQAGADIKPEFVASARESYRAESASVDFTKPATVKRIDDWVSQNTHGKITTMFDPPLPRDLRLVVLDAIYFKGTWETKFDPKLTRDQPFNLRGGQTAQRPRMSLKEKMSYFESADFQAVALPYASRQASLYVFLPKENLDKFIQDLTPENWAKWMGQFRTRDGTLELPRFKLENKYELNGELKAMGMPRAFGSEAEFGGISTGERLYISQVLQKTFVEVNEEGTEAAAASGVAIRPTMVQVPTTPFTMIVDRPFYMAIRENQTGTILFHGAIEDPK
jgi:serpin B